MESLQHAMWHSTSKRQPLSSRPHAAKDQLCDSGELTNITSPAGIFLKRRRPAGTPGCSKASIRTYMPSTAAMRSVCQRAGIPAMWFSASHSQGNLWRRNKTFDFWSRPEPPCMRHAGHLWFDWIF